MALTSVLLSLTGHAQPPETSTKQAAEAPASQPTTMPATTKPATIKPVTTTPVTATPVTTTPVTAKSVTAKPVTTKPVATKPATASKEPAPAKLEPAPHPSRQLEPSSKLRQAVSGKIPSQPAQLSKAMRQLEAFERETFLPPGRDDVALGNVSGIEGHAPPTRALRLSTETPPAELSTKDLRDLRQKSRPKRTKTPAGWLAKLALPDLPLRWDSRVIRYLEFYRSHPRGREIMAAWLQRLGRYQKLILRTLKKHGLPRDLIYVAMVESGYNPQMTSPVGAAGLWQFMKHSGRGYGLQIDYWIDERRNPELSTEAAAKYLKDLYVRFGSWDLALAAYNAGFGAVVQAVRKYNTNDYWQLCRYEAGLPWSTTLYVPKILAAAIVGRNRSFFGFDRIQPLDTFSYSLVSVTTSVTLEQAARSAGVTKEVLEELNPELRRGRTPPASKAWLRVPKTAKDRFYTQLAAIKGRARYRPYLVRLGDTASEIAIRHGISNATLRGINAVKSDTELRPGLIILVPARPQQQRSDVVLAAAKTEKTRKETEEDPVLIALPKGAPRSLPDRKRVFYKVVIGDTLSEIARHLQTSVADLASWNKLDPSGKLISGMVLQAFVPHDFDASRVALLDPDRIQVMVSGSMDFLNHYENRKGRKRLTYTVRDGDNLTRISRRFGLSVGSLMRINQFSRSTVLQAGQKIIVYVDTSKLKAKRRKRTTKKKKKQ